jgi:hypothetical protein
MIGPPESGFCLSSKSHRLTARLPKQHFVVVSFGMNPGAEGEQLTPLPHIIQMYRALVQMSGENCDWSEGGTTLWQFFHLE